MHFFFSARDWAQGLTHAGQVPYPWAPSPVQPYYVFTMQVITCIDYKQVTELSKFVFCNYKAGNNGTNS
jgi:hypothetical protein